MKGLKLKNGIVLYVLLHALTWLFILGKNFTFPNGLIYIFKKDLPPLLFLSLFYLDEFKVILKAPNIREMAEFTFKIIWIFTGVLGLSIIHLYLKGSKDLEIVLGLNWTSYAVITWIFALTIFYFSWRRHEGRLKSFILTWLTGDLAGFIYEIPIYNSMSPNVGIYFHKSHPFYVAFDWLLLPLMIVYIHKNYRLKPSRSLVIAGLIYIGFSAWYVFNKYTTILPIHRLPAILLLTMMIRQLEARAH